MEVSAWKSGRVEQVDGVTFAIRIRIADRKIYFEGLQEVNVIVGTETHCFRLNREGFWNKCSELRDTDAISPAIRNWLCKKGCLTWQKGRPPKFELKPLGNARFQLT